MVYCGDDDGGDQGCKSLGRAGRAGLSRTVRPGPAQLNLKDDGYQETI